MPVRITVLLFLLVSSGIATADETEKKKVDYPECDIFLFDLSVDDENVEISNGRNVTGTPGYENQPCFTPNSKSFLFSKSDDYQTDVYEYFIDSGETNRVTNTESMEFSPIPSPDNKTISFVTDGDTANQSVWHIKRNEPTKPQWTLKNQPEREPVGYYSWNHETGYILFWSRYGFNVRLVHQSKKLSHYVMGNAVPTTPQIIPGTNNFSFVHRQGNGQTWIKELNPETKAVRPLTPIVGINAHYAWAPDGSILMAEGSMLHRWTKDSKNGWQRVVDLKAHNVEKATRLNISPNGRLLAIVGNPVATIQK